MPNSISLARLRVDIARAERFSRRDGDKTPVAIARREYAAAKLAAIIEATLAEAPPLTKEHRSRLTALLQGGGSHG